MEEHGCSGKELQDGQDAAMHVVWGAGGDAEW